MTQTHTTFSTQVTCTSFPSEPTQNTWRQTLTRSLRQRHIPNTERFLPERTLAVEEDKGGRRHYVYFHQNWAKIRVEEDEGGRCYVYFHQDWAALVQRATHTCIKKEAGNPMEHYIFIQSRPIHCTLRSLPDVLQTQNRCTHLSHLSSIWKDGTFDEYDEPAWHYIKSTFNINEDDKKRKKT